MPPVARATAARTTSTSGADGLTWRIQCKMAARSAAVTMPANSSGSRSLSVAPVRDAMASAKVALPGGFGLEVLAVQRQATAAIRMRTHRGWTLGQTLPGRPGRRDRQRRRPGRRQRLACRTLEQTARHPDGPPGSFARRWLPSLLEK